MACLLIDYENQNGSMLDGISLVGLKSSDEIIIFYSRSSERMSMQLHKELERIPSRKYYIKTEQGKEHSLDFQLVTYLGACIQKNPDKSYYIVSKDNGYDCVCRFWKRKNIFVKRIDRIYYYCTNI